MKYIRLPLDARLLVVAALMAVGFVLPAPGGLTAYGWQLITILAGLIVGWTWIGTLLPSFAGILALILTQPLTLTDVWAEGFGSSVAAMIVVITLFSGWLESVGLVDTVMTAFLRLPYWGSHPWRFFAGFFAVVYFIGFLTSFTAALVLSWSCVMQICKLLGYEKRGRLCTWLIACCAAVGSMGAVSKPWAPWSLMCLTLLDKFFPSLTVTYPQYFAWVLPVSLVAMALILLAGRVFMRLDVAPIMAHRGALTHKEVEFTGVQKYAALLCLLMLTLLFLPSFLPQGPVKSLLTDMGVFGVFTLLILLAALAKDGRGQALLDLSALIKAGAVPWGVIFLISAMLPLAAAMQSDQAGLMPLLQAAVAPHLQGLSPLAFCGGCLVFFILASQVVSRALLLFAVLPLFMQMGTSIGASPALLTMIGVFGLVCPLGTPGASAYAGMLYGNRNVNTADCFRTAWLCVTAIFLSISLVGLPLGMLLFD